MDMWSEHTRFGLSLFALISPLPVIPVFLGLTASLNPREKITAATVAALTLFGVLMLGYYVGEPLISALGSSIASFQIAGGVIIGLSGFSMLNAQSTRPEASGEPKQRLSPVAVGVVPVGIPLLGGPGSMTAVMLEGHGHFSVSHEGIVLAIIVICCLLTWVCLLFAGAIARAFGETGLGIFQRAFGVIVIAVGVEIAVRGIRAHVESFIAGM